MGRKAQFMKSLISIHAESNSYFLNELITPLSLKQNQDNNLQKKGKSKMYNHKNQYAKNTFTTSSDDDKINKENTGSSYPAF